MENAFANILAPNSTVGKSSGGSSNAFAGLLTGGSKSSSVSSPSPVSPAISGAIENVDKNLKEPSLIQKFWDNFINREPAYAFQRNKTVDGITAPIAPTDKNALQAKIITGPSLNDLNTFKDDIGKQHQDLLNLKDTIDLSDENKVNEFNNKVNKINTDSKSYSDAIDKYNQVQKAHQVIGIDKGEGSLGPTLEQQLEKGVTLAGITAALPELGVAIAADAVAGEASIGLGSTLLKYAKNAAIGVPAFMAMDKALQGAKENASDPEKFLIFAGELFATGGLLHGINEAVPKLGDKLFQTITEKYNAPKTVFFDGQKVQQLIAHGDMTNADTRALVDAIGGDNNKTKLAFKNGISIELPAEKLKTIAESPLWTKLKSAFGVKPVTGETIQPLGKAKETVRGYLESPKIDKEGIEKIAQDIKEGKNPNATIPTGTGVGIDPESLSALAEQVSNKEKPLSPVEENIEEKIGPHGTIHEGLDFDTAVKTLLENKSGEAKGVAVNPTLGKIDLIYGEPGKGGYGLAKISDVHPEVIPHLKELLETGEVVGGVDGRKYLETDKGKAVIRLDWEANEKRWVLTAFLKDPTLDELSRASRTTSVTEANANVPRENTIPEEEGKSQVERKQLEEVPADIKRVIEYRNRLRLRGVDPVLVNAIITPSGKTAYGVSVEGHIGLEKVVQQFTEDHEIFHQIFKHFEKMRLFKGFDRQTLLAEAKALYGDLTPKQLEEEMAKDFQQFVKDQESGKPTSFFGKIAEFFQKLLASVKRLFRNETDIKEFYRTIYEGKATEDTVIPKNEKLQKFIDDAKTTGTMDFRKEQYALGKFLEKTPEKEIFNDRGDVTLKTLTKLEGHSTVSKQFIEDLTNSSDIKQPERDLLRAMLETEPDTVNIPEFAERVRDELLPLKVYSHTGGGSGKKYYPSRYENISLPNDIRGNISNYREHIYESPIATSAGDVHSFRTKNYFGHTRIEDMAGEYVETPKGAYDLPENTTHALRKGSDIFKKGDTRRVIEVQSDLYQKGNIEKEFDSRSKAMEALGTKKEYDNLLNESYEGRRIANSESRVAELRGQADEYLKKKMTESPLLQYNNPSAHFRMVREEVRQAARDGKTKLQFPTGETAMKIEGLGQENTGWRFTGEGGHGEYLTPNTKLEAGQEIFRIGDQGWIITNILGDGKFKAVPKDKYEAYDMGGNTNPAAQTVFNNYAEEFDISGKVDTNNPIYRFYEKDLGRYLKNNFGAVPVTDDKGVTWMEVPVNKEYADLPVPAFNEKEEKNPVFDTGDKLEDLKRTLQHVENRVGVNPVMDKLNNQLIREKISLASAEENPAMHQKAYGENRIPKYKARIEELQKKIEEVTPKNDIPKIHVSGKEVTLPEDINKRQLLLELSREQLHLSPYKELIPYLAKSGEFKGMLPEVLGKGKANLKGTSYEKLKGTKVLDFIQNGDQIIQEIFGSQNTPDTEEVRSNMQDYLEDINSLKDESIVLAKDIGSYIKSEKDNIALDKLSKKALTDQEKTDLKEKEKESLANWKNLFKTYAEEASLPQNVSEVEPPIVRGGIQAPKLNLEQWKDKGWNSRDSLDRNIEKVAPREDAKLVNEFLTDHLRENATTETQYINNVFEPLRKTLKDFGLKKGGKDSALIQKYGEGLISDEELKALSPDKWQDIQKVVQNFHRIYDKTIDDWNAMRRQFGYPEVPKRNNYFPHFQDISFWTKNYGILSNDDELPTSIAGKTENFKPGKAFSRHELSRTGRDTKYDAIEGMEVYIKSVARQMFSMDSIARADALEKYITQAAKIGERTGNPLHLSRFMTNFQEVFKNQIRAKMGTLDRAGEVFGDRRIINSLLTISKLIGKNIIAFNPATALTHLVSIPLNIATTDKVPWIKGMMTTVSSPFSKEPFYMIDGHQSDLLYRRYPQEHILNTKFESAEQAGGWMLRQMDIFKVRTAVSGKYYELVGKGMDPEEAMRKADIYAGHIVGDYTRGLKPIILNQKMARLFAQFQFGMNDAISVLLHDIPYDNKKEFTDEDGYTFEKNNYRKQVWKYAQWAIYAFLMNQVLKQIKGSGKGMDPIDLALTLAGVNEEGSGKGIGERIGLAGTDFAGEIPGTSLFTGNFPTATAFSQPIKDLLSGDKLKAGEDFASLFVSPIGGGLQAKKTIEGAFAIKKGEAKGVGQDTKALLFGAGTANTPDTIVSKKLNTKLKTAETKLSNFDPDLVSKVQTVFDQAKSAGFGTPEADALVADLSDNEYKIYQAMKSVENVKQSIDLESKVLPIVRQANELGFGTPEADKLIENLPDDEYDAYKSLKTALYGANAVGTQLEPTTTPDIPTGTWDKQSLVSHIANIAKAIGTDPVTAFDDIFHGDYKITGLKNGQIIVNRMTLADSEAVKKTRGGNNPEYKLDHAVPLEIGGTNRGSNLQLIPTDQWKINTPVENYLSSQLSNGTITGKEAREYAIRFKAGQNEPMSDTLQKEYKDKYGSKPLTFDEIKSLISNQ